MNTKLITFAFVMVATFAYGHHSASAQSVNLDSILPAIPTITAAPAADDPSKISVSWSATDDIGVTSYSLFRNGSLIATGNITTYTDVELPAGYYSYMVRAYDAAGNVSPWSAPAGASVIKDITRPSAPGALSVSINYRIPHVVLSWGAATDNAGVKGYNLYKNGAYRRVDPPLTGTTYTDTDVTPGTTYSYDVAAYDAAGNISDHTPRVDAVITIDRIPPTIPTGLTAVLTSTSAVALTWKATIDNLGVTGYYVYRNGTQIADLASTTLLYVDSGLADGLYTYTVAAYDASGNVSSPSYPANITVVKDLNPPSIPADLFAKPVSTTRIDLTWRASFDNVGVVGYYVYRDTVQIAITSSVAYSDTGLSAAKQYTYTVAAYDAAGNISGLSYIFQATTPSTNTPAMTMGIIPYTAPTPISAITTNPTTPITKPGNLTLGLYRGRRGGEVPILQGLLYRWKYITADSQTGYFGLLTEQAVKKFQCDKAIVCSGSPASTGWGSVGARTRKAMNDLQNAEK